MNETDSPIETGLPKEQVKQTLPCGETKYWTLLKAGEFPNAYKVGNRSIVPPSDIEAYKKRHRVSFPKCDTTWQSQP